MQKNDFLKTERIFSPVKKYSWLFLVLVAFGGLRYPALGLLLIPVMLALPVLGFLKGKYWCGTICPHGSFFDGVLLPITKNNKIPGWATSKITIGLAFFWFMYIFYNRSMTAFEFWGQSSFYEKFGFVFVANYLAVTLIGSMLSVTVSSRTWCRFCPMGTFQLLSYKLGSITGLNKHTNPKVTISQENACISCMRCAKVCPVQLQPAGHFEKNQFHNQDCIKCGTCVKNCPLTLLAIEEKSKKNKEVS